MRQPGRLPGGSLDAAARSGKPRDTSERFNCLAARPRDLSLSAWAHAGVFQERGLRPWRRLSLLRVGTLVDGEGLTAKRRSDHENGEAIMDENRVEGTTREFGGKVQEGMGRLTGNARRQAEGLANQAAGAAQDLYGQAADNARETAASFERSLRHTIETQPYLSAFVALGIGWLLGRMHRPL